jgi:hypothetical protein
MPQHIKDRTNLQHFIDISIRLTTEKEPQLLLDEILQVVMSIANSDAGSIYSVQIVLLVFPTLTYISMANQTNEQSLPMLLIQAK